MKQYTSEEMARLMAAFDPIDLTLAMNDEEPLQTPLAGLKLFHPVACPKPEAAISRDVVSRREPLITPRGNRGTPPERPSANVELFKILHIPVDDTVLPDDVVNLRGKGEGEQAVLKRIISNYLRDMREALDLKREKLYLQAIRGKIEERGAVYADYETRFGKTARKMELAVSSAATDIPRTLDQIIAGYKGKSVGAGLIFLCSQTVFADVVNHKSIKELFARRMDATPYTEALVSEFPLKGVTFMSYDPTPFSAASAIDPAEAQLADNEALIFPRAPGRRFVEFFGPADVFGGEDATPAAPYYVQTIPKIDNTGVMLSAQMNVLPVVADPSLVVKVAIK